MYSKAHSKLHNILPDGNINKQSSNQKRKKEISINRVDCGQTTTTIRSLKFRVLGFHIDAKVEPCSSFTLFVVGYSCVVSFLSARIKPCHDFLLAIDSPRCSGKFSFFNSLVI